MNDAQRALERLPLALVFQAVARLGSFSDAAESLGLARSTVSQRVSALEQSLGVRLLHRTTRSVGLTSAGQELLDQMGPLLAGWKEAEARTESYADEPKGRIAITAADLLMLQWVTPAVARYRRRFPDVEVVLKASTDTLALLDEGIDVALRAGPLPPSEYGASLLWRGPHIALAHPDLRARFPGKRPTDLTTAPWLALDGRRPIERWTHRRDASEVPFRVPTPLITDSPSVYLSLLHEGAGFGVLPEVLARPALRSGAVVHVLEDWVADEVSFHLVTPSARRLDAAVRALVAEISGVEAPRD